MRRLHLPEKNVPSERAEEEGGDGYWYVLRDTVIEKVHPLTGEIEVIPVRGSIVGNGGCLTQLVFILWCFPSIES